VCPETHLRIHDVIADEEVFGAMVGNMNFIRRNAQLDEADPGAPKRGFISEYCQELHDDPFSLRAEYCAIRPTCRLETGSGVVVRQIQQPELGRGSNV
jgi:hypothetical protein